jgi:hypothetical protein
MTPKEKATELIEKFMLMEFSLLQEYIPNPMVAAKKCASITCDTMLENAGFIWGGVDHEAGLTARDSFRKYWSQVKTEISLI